MRADAAADGKREGAPSARAAAAVTTGSTAGLGLRHGAQPSVEPSSSVEPLSEQPPRPPAAACLPATDCADLSPDVASDPVAMSASAAAVSAREASAAGAAQPLAAPATPDAATEAAAATSSVLQALAAALSSKGKVAASGAVATEAAAEAVAAAPVEVASTATAPLSTASAAEVQRSSEGESRLLKEAVAPSEGDLAPREVDVPGTKVGMEEAEGVRASPSHSLAGGLSLGEALRITVGGRPTEARGR